MYSRFYFIYIFAFIFNRTREYYKKKKRGVDYNAEIPFYKKPPPGQYTNSSVNGNNVSLCVCVRIL